MLTGGHRIGVDDIVLSGYLEGDGDFRSAEVTKLRDEADIIITNPPFSLFREFLAWIMEANKKFVILGNMNAIACKEVFPLIKSNEIWLGYNQGGSRKGNSMFFIVPDDYDGKYVEIRNGHRYTPITGKWFTNLDHGKRHETLLLDTMAHNLKFNTRLRNKFEKEYGIVEYPYYENFDALEVPFTDAIPSDYKGTMGVPITFLDRYNPEQFKLLGMAAGNTRACGFNYEIAYTQHPDDRGGCGIVHGKRVYSRLFIQLNKL